MRTKNLIAEIVIFLLLLMWAYTFASKVLDFDTFRRQINGAYLLSSLGSALPYVLQVLHLSLVVLLIKKSWRKIGLITSLSVLLLYTGYLIYILKFAPSIPCSCISLYSGFTWNDQLLINFAVLVLNIIGLIMFSFKRPPHSSHIQTTY
ncbi:NAD/NADP transhydrogenase beta subunit [Chryseobacterium rhizosphaerae]|uniref:MauE/DoxX family redox-associated membrane protein n=1 Tax=Chryseobacterium rhizosphaerae TaxID=395937 RepID=UPI0028626905|nr:NAD/NADP transhydrogenase beta subunit [Chryseobacterium rhizosphaerae]